MRTRGGRDSRPGPTALPSQSQKATPGLSKAEGSAQRDGENLPQPLAEDDTELDSEETISRAAGLQV